MQHWELLFFFLFIAFVYASVGFGGGSSYLAVLALYALPFKELRFIALLMIKKRYGKKMPYPG